MTTTNSNGQTERTQASVAQLTAEERKLVERIDERASNRQAKRAGVIRRMLSQPLIGY